MMNKEKKISFIERVIISVKDFDRYSELAILTAKSTFRYLLMLMLIVSLIVGSLLLYNISKQVTSLREYISKEISDISYKEGILEIQNNIPIILENENNIFSKIIIDTSELEKEKQDEYINNLLKSKTGFILFKDKIILKADVSNATVGYNYKEISEKYNLNEFNKNFVLEQFNFNNMLILYLSMFIAISFYILIFFLIETAINILLLAALGYFTAILLRLKLRYSTMCKISTYAITLPVILEIIYIIVNNIFGFTIKYFEAAYLGIAYIYIMTTILLIKADVIKKGKELAKILEEQEKIREEMAKKEEEEKRKEEDKEQEEKQNKKEDKEDKKHDENGKIGNEPQSDNV